MPGGGHRGLGPCQRASLRQACLEDEEAATACRCHRAAVSEESCCVQDPSQAAISKDARPRPQQAQRPADPAEAGTTQPTSHVPVSGQPRARLLARLHPSGGRPSPPSVKLGCSLLTDPKHEGSARARPSPGRDREPGASPSGHRLVCAGEVRAEPPGPLHPTAHVPGLLAPTPPGQQLAVQGWQCPQQCLGVQGQG